MESTPCLNAEQALLQCRLCLADDLDELISLHCRCASHQDKLLVEMITEVTRLDTFDREADTLPQHICSQCLTRLDAAYSFLRIAKDASAALDRSGDRCQICHRDAVDELISMFCVSASDGQLIVDMLRDVCGVSCLEEDDDQQKYVCRECFGLLSGVYCFRNMILESDTSWRQTLELENDLTNDTVEIGDPIKIEPMEVHDEDILITSTRETRNAYLQEQAKIKGKYSILNRQPLQLQYDLRIRFLIDGHLPLDFCYTHP